MAFATGASLPVSGINVHYYIAHYSFFFLQSCTTLQASSTHESSSIICTQSPNQKKKKSSCNIVKAQSVKIDSSIGDDSEILEAISELLCLGI